MPASRARTETLPPLLEARNVRGKLGLTQSNSGRSSAFRRRRCAPASVAKRHEDAPMAPTLIR